MNRKLLLVFFVFISQICLAQVATIRPSTALRGQSITTTITASTGQISLSSGPYGSTDIYLQQGNNVINCDPSFNPNINIYPGSWPTYVSDSLYCIFNIPTNAFPGWYDVHVITYDYLSNPIDNVLIDGFLIQKSFAGRVSGSVYFDVNQDGGFDPGEFPMANHRIIFNPLGLTTFTDAQGNYNAPLDTGTYTIAYLPPPGFAQTSAPLTYTATLPPSSSSNDFGTYKAGIIYAHTLGVCHTNHRCLGYGYAYITVTNTGIFPTQGSVSLIYSTNMSFVSSLPPPDAINGDTLTWNYFNLLPGQSFVLGQSGWITFLNPASGQTVNYTVIDSVEDLSGNSVAIYTNPFSTVVTCSYDPNEKDVVPVGIGNAHYTPISSDLTYTIKFQNTGNDTAYNVSLYDTLDANLDLSTMEILGSSHPVTVLMSSGGETEFFFENIMLPDSNVDEPGSNGFVSYRIRPLAGLPDPTVITNTSYIVFDYNDPVITNTAMNTLTALQYPSATFNSPTPHICANSCITYAADVQSGTAYQWLFPGGSPATSTDPNPTVCYFSAGTYDVTLIATNALGTDTLDQPSFTIVDPMPSPVVNQVGDSLIATAGYASYQWYYFSTPIMGVNGPGLAVTQDGDYTLVVTNSYGCQSSVIILNVLTGISDVFADGSTISLFPNPSSGDFKIQFKAPANLSAHVELMNAAGQLVFSNEIKTSNGVNSIDVTGISKGVYSLRFTTRNGSVIRKVVVQ